MCSGSGNGSTARRSPEAGPPPILVGGGGESVGGTEWRSVLFKKESISSATTLHLTNYQ